MGINGRVLVQKPEIGNGVSAEEVLDGPLTSQFHVLAVDDSVVNRKIIEKLFRSSACKVTTVDSGRRGLEFLGLDKEQNSVAMENIKVNMIITDYCMPGMTGYDLLKKIKESATFKEIPVLIMSSENIMDRINRCLEEGAEEFLLKPVKLSDVKRLKRHIVNGLSKDQKDENKEDEKQPVSSRRKSMSDENDMPTQASERRPRI